MSFRLIRLQSWQAARGLKLALRLIRGRRQSPKTQAEHQREQTTYQTGSNPKMLSALKHNKQTIKKKTAMNRFLKNKTRKMLAMASILMFAVSCSQDIENETSGTDITGGSTSSEVKLQFTTGPATRGTMYDEIGAMPDDSKFSVYGYSCKGGFDKMGTAPNFIANGEASKDGTVTVDDAVKHYNSQEPYVQLAAVYPKLEGNNSLQKTGVDQYSLTYDIGASDDATLHKDLMIGKTNVEVKAQEEQQPATITLHHALTAVNFAIGDKCPTGYEIAGIEMQGLAAKGTCELKFSGDTPTFNWTPSDTKELISLKWPKYEGVSSTTVTPNKTTQVNRTQVTGVKTDGKRDNLTIFMIPQQLGADAKAVIWLKKDNGLYRQSSPNNDKDHRAAVKKITINLAAVKAWQPGQAVVYGIDEQLEDADLRYRFNLSKPVVESKPGDDGLSTATFNLNSYRYTYYGTVSKFTRDAYTALQTYQIVKYAYEDEAGMPHETVTNELPDWITLSVTPKKDYGRVTASYNMAVKVDHTKANYPAGIKKLFITFKQDASEQAERTVEITGLQPKASN